MKLRLNVNGKTYEVEVEVLEEEGLQRGQSRPAATSSAAPTIAPPASAAPPQASLGESSSNDNCFRSPISGVVVRVCVEVGQAVSANQDLMVLEAMKMETVLASHCAGKVSKICAKVGDAVQVSQPLVEFE